MSPDDHMVPISVSGGMLAGTRLIQDGGQPGSQMDFVDSYRDYGQARQVNDFLGNDNQFHFLCYVNLRCLLSKVM